MKRNAKLLLIIGFIGLALIVLNYAILPICQGGNQPTFCSYDAIGFIIGVPLLVFAALVGLIKLFIHFLKE
jgi:hypothetical protein